MSRTSTKQRKTQETDIDLSLNLNGTRKIDLDMDIPFFPHLLKSMVFHAGWDLRVRALGDLEVDAHHTVEDVGIVLGQALREALDSGPAYRRFASCFIPMDEALAQAVVDVSGRAYLIYDAPHLPERVGCFPTELAEEFLRSLTSNARITLHAKIWWGKSAHHLLEALFKATGRALGEACRTSDEEVASTKGTLS